MEDLNAASLEDVQRVVQDVLRPRNAVLVIAGDIDAATAKAKVEKYFGEIPPTPPVDKQRAWVVKMTGTHRMTMQDRVPQTRVLKTWNTPEWGNPESTLLELASRVLSTGRSSRLQKRLVYDEQLATNVGSGVDRPGDRRQVHGAGRRAARGGPGEGGKGAGRGDGEVPRLRPHRRPSWSA